MGSRRRPRRGADPVPGSARARFGPALGTLLLLSVSLALSAVAAEVGLRLLGHHGAPVMAIRNAYAVDDPVLDWRYLPNSEVRIGRIVYRYNSAGFRDVDHAVERPPRTNRILVLGDSVSEGYGVDWPDVFASVVQSSLGAGCEVINIAAGGLNTPQEVHLFEQAGLRYRPDVVVLNFVLNDGDFYTRLEAARRYIAAQERRIGLLDVPVHPKVKEWLKSSALIYFVKERVEDLKGRVLGREEFDHYARTWSREESRRRVTAGFDRLAWLQREHGFQVIVLVWPLLADYTRYPFTAVHEWVTTAATEAGFAVTDLLPVLSAIPHRRLQVTAEDSVHPNGLGHRLAARAFLAWYTANRGCGAAGPGLPGRAAGAGAGGA
jgi:lysophospholipase L1-like esterase